MKKSRKNKRKRKYDQPALVNEEASREKYICKINRIILIRETMKPFRYGWLN